MWQPVPWYLTAIPRPRPDTIERERLSDRLADLLGRHRVVAVNAPSGHGKTVAVADWARSSDLPVAWLSVPHTENDPGELLRGMISSVSRLPQLRDHPAVAALHTPSTSTSPAGFAATVDEIGQRVVLVLDDAHRAADALADPAIADLLEHGPARLSIVLIGHSTLSRSVSRAILHGVCGVIGASELTFTLDEVERACVDAGPQFDPGHVWTATGGWPIAVYASRMGGRAASLDGGDPESLLTDYVADEILAPLPTELSEFILDTTTTARFDTELATTLTGRSDAAALIEECVRRGLFLSRYSDTARSTTVYAWHSLFVEHCRRVLTRTDPDRQRKARESAAEHLRDTDPLLAARLSLLADDAGRAVDILVDNWVGLVISSGATPTEATATSLAEHTDNPAHLCHLTFIRACCRAIRGDMLGARRLFDDACAQFERGPDARLELTAALTTILYANDHTCLVAAHDRVVAILDDPVAVEHMRPGLRAGCAFVVGWTAPRLRSDADRGVALIRTAIEECRAAGLATLAQRAESNHAFALAFAGRFTETAETISASADRGRDGGEWDYYDVGISNFTRGWFNFWTGELDTALEFFSRDTQSRTMDGYPPLARLYRVITAAVLHDGTALPDAETGAESVADEFLHGVPWPVYRRLALARAAEFKGDGDTVRRMATEIEQIPAVPVSRALFAGMLRRLGELDWSRRFLEGLEAPELPSYVRAYASLTHAVIAWQSGDRDRAHRLLGKSLAVAEPERIMLPFLDNTDLATTELLDAHVSRGSAPLFLAEALSRRMSLSHRSAGVSSPLTRREHEVLEYLRMPMTVNEIADALFISPNTLKTHCRSLYRKLGVTNRRGAVRVVGVAAR
ncbi:LuxR C-terminal-related transcriptional regulator [Gordonia sp. DT30]|uniref:helix-turn-helix transcriptional regulator n=1 Tax=Gordonia sp. DT30 TaxID=3416546 RepID=UPI003CF91E3E